MMVIIILIKHSFCMACWSHPPHVCDGADESLEHLFSSCQITQSFWAEVIKWCNNRGVVINHISAKDILFGKKVHKDNLFINHMLLVGEPNRIDVLLNAAVQQQCFDNTKVFNSILTVR